MKECSDESQQLRRCKQNNWIAELQLTIDNWERRTNEKEEPNTKRYEDGKSNLEGLEDPGTSPFLVEERREVPSMRPFLSSIAFCSILILTTRHNTCNATATTMRHKKKTYGRSGINFGIGHGCLVLYIQEERKVGRLELCFGLYSAKSEDVVARCLLVDAWRSRWRRSRGGS